MKGGWRAKTLGEVCDIRTGSTPSKIDSAYWKGGTIPWFTIDDIRDQGRYITRTRKTITDKAVRETSVKLLPAQSVLLCCTASVGEYALTQIPLTTNQQFNGLVVRDTSCLDPNFLFHFASTLRPWLLSVSGKTTIDFIPLSRLQEALVPLPPLPEQQRIVRILAEALASIATAKAKAEKNLQNVRALFESSLRTTFSSQIEDQSGCDTRAAEPSTPEQSSDARLSTAGPIDQEATGLVAERQLSVKFREICPYLSECLNV